MIRFKVIKGSHLLLGIAVAVLVGVLAFILLQSPLASTSNTFPNAEIAQPVVSEAKAQAAFASSTFPRLEIEIMPEPTAETTFSAAKNILVYHTHTHEAYAQDSRDPYVAIEAWRTEDMMHSVVRLGTLLAEELRMRGYNVTHDVTDHEQNSLSDAYLRSLETLESYEQAFDLCIDLHRDAFTEGLKPCLEANGTQYAQLMMLVGRGDAYSDGEKPDYESNRTFAQYLTGILNTEIEGICRNVTVKKGRYNQHIGRNNILVEVGHNENTLQQAIASIPCLAEGIDLTLQHFH